MRSDVTIRKDVVYTIDFQTNDQEQNPDDFVERFVSPHRDLVRRKNDPFWCLVLIKKYTKRRCLQGMSIFEVTNV